MSESTFTFHTDFSTVIELESLFQQNSYHNNNNFILITPSYRPPSLIFGLNTKDVQTDTDATLILTTDGLVYFVPNTNIIKQPYHSGWNKFVDFNKDISCIEFTKSDPIESIHAKFGNFYTFINKMGQVYLLSTEENYCGKLDSKLFDNKKVIKAASGSEHILFLTNDGCVYSLGTAYEGKLGHGKTINSNFNSAWCFGKCNTKEKIIDISATYNTSFILTENGKVYSCGDNTYAADAQPKGFQKLRNEFQLVQNDKLVKEFIAGYFFAAFKTVDDKYQIFGYNNFCQFTDDFNNNCIYGPTDFILKKSEIKEDDIYQMECGGYGSVVVTKNCKIYYTGEFSCRAMFGRSVTNFTQTAHSNILSTRIKDLKNFKIRCGTSTTVYFTTSTKNIVEIFNLKNIWKISDCDMYFDN